MWYFCDITTVILAGLAFGFQKHKVYWYVCSHRDAFLKFDIVSPLANLLEDPENACRKNVHQALKRIAEFPSGNYCFLYFCFTVNVCQKLFIWRDLCYILYRSSIYGVYGVGAQIGDEGLRWRREHPCFNSLHFKLLCECERLACTREWCDSGPERSALSPLPRHPPGCHICLSGNQVGNMASNNLVWI